MKNAVHSSAHQESPAREMLAAFLAAGGLALTAQVILLRELMVVLQGDETSIGLGMAGWLGGIALGAWVARGRVHRFSGRWAAAGLGWMAAAGFAGAVALRFSRSLLHPPPGELIPLEGALVLTLLVFPTAGVSVGVTFPALAAAAVRAGWPPGRGIAALYVTESAGSLIAGVVITLVVVPYLAPLTGAALAPAVWLAATFPAARKKRIAGRVVLPVLALALLALGLPPGSRAIQAASVAARFRGIAPGLPVRTWTDTPYQHVDLAGDGPYHLYLSGQYAGSFPDPFEDETRAHVLAVMAPRPRRVLLVGSAPPGMVRFLLLHPVERVDVVTMDAREVAMVRRFLPAADRAALEGPKARWITDDPRRFLGRSDERYDLIVVREPSPVTLLLARYSTVEFFRQCRAHLRPGGALVFSLRTAANVLTPSTSALAGSVYGALDAAFPVVRATPGPDGYLVAGTDPAAVTLDPEVLARRFEQRGIRSEVFSPQLYPLLLPPERVADMERQIRLAARRVPPSRDLRPVSLLYALALRQRIAGSVFARPLSRLARWNPWRLRAVVVAPSLLFLGWLFLRRRRRGALPASALHAMVVTGACGMGWSLLALFSFQSRVGALYGQIGWLTAVFMLGLALGAAWTLRWSDAPFATRQAVLTASVGAAAIYSVVVPGALRLAAVTSGGAASALHAAMLLAAGASTGALFPAAAGMILDSRTPARTAGALESADHLGGALAALVTAVVLVPALGLPGSAWLLAGLEGLALSGIALAATSSPT